MSEIKPQDIEGAKKLLAEAGYPDGLTVELNTGEGSPGMVALAQAYQQMAAEAGITVNIINNPADSYWDVTWMKKPFFGSNWSGRPAAEGLPYTFTSDADLQRSQVEESRVRQAARPGTRRGRSGQAPAALQGRAEAPVGGRRRDRARTSPATWR